MPTAAYGRDRVPGCNIHTTILVPSFDAAIDSMSCLPKPVVPCWALVAFPAHPHRRGKCPLPVHHPPVDYVLVSLSLSIFPLCFCKGSPHGNRFIGTDKGSWPLAMCARSIIIFSSPTIYVRSTYLASGSRTILETKRRREKKMESNFPGC